MNLVGVVDVASRMNARKNYEDLAESSASIGRLLVHQESAAPPKPLDESPCLIMLVLLARSRCASTS
jgi:hypothetical protein